MKCYRCHIDESDTYLVGNGTASILSMDLCCVCYKWMINEFDGKDAKYINAVIEFWTEHIEASHKEA